MLRTVGRVGELWSGEMRRVVVDGLPVLLVNVDDVIHAYEDRCAHQGVALSEGTFDGKVITCSAHFWQYDAATGEGVNPKGVCLERLSVAIDGEEVKIDLPQEQVGPVLEAGPVGDAVIAAIRALNAETTIHDRGGYVRALCPQRCVVTRAAIEEALGAPFRLPGDLEIIMPSFQGAFHVTETEAVWRAGRCR